MESFLPSGFDLSDFLARPGMTILRLAMTSVADRVDPLPLRWAGGATLQTARGVRPAGPADTTS